MRQKIVLNHLPKSYKLTEKLASAETTLLSLEIMPPRVGQQFDALLQQLMPILEFQPSFINVTYHQQEKIYREKPDGTIEKIVLRKRPGTVGISAALKYKTGVEVVPHLICGGFTKEETESALFDLHYLDIKNVMLLRGDPPPGNKHFIPEPNGHKYAVDLVRQVANMNRGIYLDHSLLDPQPTDFCIGVAGYPEKHYEAPNMTVDLQNLKAKVDAGAHYIVTQMFFDNRYFFEFEKKCRDIGIRVPIIPGIKPISRKKQLKTIPKTFHVSLPEELTTELLKAKDDSHAYEIGIEWAIHQSKELKRAGVPMLHYYTMGRMQNIFRILSEVF